MLTPRAIVHLDGDAFFAAVEQAADPRLRGKPVAVGGERRGVIASASYEARRYGLRAAMPTAQARKLCPHLIVVPGDFERYEQFSRLMFAYAEDHTPLVEVRGLDEGFFDLTANRARPPAETAAIVQRAIRQSLKITVSEGLASNKLVSQIASKANKPAGFQVIPPGAETAFLHPLPNRWLPGVGPVLAGRLNAAGLAEIRHIAQTPVDLLECLVGSQAAQLARFARGLDDRPVVPERAPQQSYSAQETFAADLTDEDYADATLRRMADTLFAKVRADGRAIRTLTVTVCYNDHDQAQASESLREPTALETDVHGRLRALLRRAWERRVSLRRVGLKLSNLYDGRFTGELDLPGAGLTLHRRQQAVLAVESLRQRLGPAIILRGHDLILRRGPLDPTLGSALSPARDPTLGDGTVRPRRSEEPARGLRSALGLGARRITVHVSASRAPAYVPLGCQSHYSFLDSILSPEDVVGLARRSGAPAVALTDLGNLHGAGEFALAARDQGIRPVFGAAFQTEHGPLRVYVQDRTGYTNLCRLLTLQGAAASPGEEDDAVATRQRLPLSGGALSRHADGLIAIGTDDRWGAAFGDRFYRAVSGRELADHPRGVVVPRVHYAAPSDARLFDIVQSVRTRTLLQEPHPGKRSGDLSFRPASRLPGWCLGQPRLLERTREIADRCSFEFPFGPPQFPDFVTPDGSSPTAFLRRLVTDGLRRRYGDRPEARRAQVDEELGMIAAVGYEPLFLHTWSLLQDCRAAGIEWITRGSAADSLVCYCLGISNVCPIRFELYFKRFLNPERMALDKLPDIDIDFPHDRKDDVVRLLFARFGAEHCAVVGGFSTFQARSAFAEAAKVLGLSESQVRRFTDRFPWSGGGHLRAALEHGIETRALPIHEEPYRTAIELAALLDGRPRHPKMHPCGLVLTRQSVQELTPTFLSQKGWPTTHYDMDITEAIGLVKMDVLAQGGLAVLRDARDAIRRNHGVTVDLAGLAPWNDPGVWRLIASGGARAVHHIESPAMLNLCRMSNVRDIDGLIAIVSVIRPGAANENKKRTFTRRYQRMEPPVYPHPCLEECLRSTFGLVVYEEHILQIAETYAGLSAGRADLLRRALVKQRPRIVAEIQPEFFAAAAARGHPIEKTREVWQIITGFQGYAFNKAHSTAYGVEAFEAAWVKDRYPAEFLAGVLTHGKGFYSRLVYILECHRLGLRLLPPSIQEPGPGYVAGPAGIRVPAGAIKNLRESTRTRLVAERARGPFAGIEDFAQRVDALPEELEALARVGAFDACGETRLEQFWRIQQWACGRGRGRAAGSASRQWWLLPAPGLDRLPRGALREPSLHERLESEWELLGFTVSAHPLALYDDIDWASYCPLSRAGAFLGQEITVCGLVVEQRIHHQVTGEPMKFLTIADRSDIASTDLFADTYRSYGLATVRYPVLEVTAKVEPFENANGWGLRALRAGRPRPARARPATAPAPA